MTWNNWEMIPETRNYIFNSKNDVDVLAVVDVVFTVE